MKKRSLEVNKWYHVAGTWVPSTAGGMVLFINGRAVATIAGTTSSSLPNATTPLWFGRRAYSGFEDNLNGAIDDVSIWSRALSAAEIAQLYAEGRTGHPTILRRARGVTSSYSPAPSFNSAWAARNNLVFLGGVA